MARRAGACRGPAWRPRHAGTAVWRRRIACVRHARTSVLRGRDARAGQRVNRPPPAGRKCLADLGLGVHATRRRRAARRARPRRSGGCPTARRRDHAVATAATRDRARAARRRARPPPSRSTHPSARRTPDEGQSSSSPPPPSSRPPPAPRRPGQLRRRRRERVRRRCSVTNTVSATVPTVARMSISNTATTLRAPAAADFGARRGHPDGGATGAPTITVAANAGYTVTASATVGWPEGGQLYAPSRPTTSRSASRSGRPRPGTTRRSARSRRRRPPARHAVQARLRDQVQLDDRRPGQLLARLTFTLTAP
jgi:hypothetical protein